VRAAIFKRIGQPLAIETIPDPEPSDGSVVVQVGRCGVCGTDLNMTSGDGPSYPENSAIGHEIAGEVVACGRGVTSLAVGDRIAAMGVFGCGRCGHCREGDPMLCRELRGAEGGFGEFMQAPVGGCLKLPESLSLSDGALIEPLACGHHATNVAGLEPGARVLVVGAGAMGLGVTHYARHYGVGPIVVTAPSRRAADAAMAMGASAFLTNDEGPVEQALGGAPDIVFECAGKPGLIGEAIDRVRPRGKVVVCGICAMPDSFVPATALMKEVQIRFAVAYTLRDFEIVARLFDSGRIEPRAMVTETISLDALPAVFEALRGPTQQRKVHVDPWAEET
jgi:(R,R)-butanediol dehydrogenase/meso-butanediol dehydrogenase/diacetyl reductase